LYYLYIDGYYFTDKHIFALEAALQELLEKYRSEIELSGNYDSANDLTIQLTTIYIRVLGKLGY
jgi:hypothetical protein